MKSSLKNRILFCLLGTPLPLLVVSCLFFDNIIQPESALVESEIEITAQLRVAPETNGNGRLVFAMLAPKAWNLKENATLLLTTTDYANQGYSEIVNESLTPMPDTETDPKNGMAWSASFASVIGMGGNDGSVEMEWIVWRSSTTFDIWDKKTVDGVETALPNVHANVKIRFTTGATPVKCELGYSYCYDTYGLQRDDQRFAEAFKPFETYEQVFTTSPSVFRYGDIFAITFSPGSTDLKGASEVYLCGTAVHDGGQRTEVTTAGDKNRMSVSGSRFEKYIYPKDFFGLPSDAVIEELSFYFINADGSIVVRDDENGGKEFFVGQSAE